MKEMRSLIEEEMDKCLVTDDEWDFMLQNSLTLEVKDDPF